MVAVSVTALYRCQQSTTGTRCVGSRRGSLSVCVCVCVCVGVTAPPILLLQLMFKRSERKSWHLVLFFLILHAESCVARHSEIKRSSHMFWRKMHKQQRIQAKPEHAYLARKDGFEPRVKLRSGVHRELNKSMWTIDVNAAARLLHRSLKANIRYSRVPLPWPEYMQWN